ncbi:hypothetical protein G7Y89_g3474 [Cudoniella acicularis]|uniref:BSD domain-containing protein n=1 Tax=Cudoniella acicularis TaxID=354080 RepID=A0A8H4RRA0_9HELO|nr:hypothetical protein G7Y89_g3474 [Cudoniella acicularis]
MAPPPASAVQGSAAYKKKDGTLSITRDQRSLQWLPVGARDSEKAVAIPIANITNLQQTPESAAKVMLKVFEKSPDATESVTHLFHFNSSTNPRGEANTVKDALTALISAIKTSDSSLPRANGSGPASAAMAIASAVTSKQSSASSKWFDDNALKVDIELQQSLMKKNPALHRTYMEARRTKPDTISDSQFNSQFWSTRTNVLRAHGIEVNQKRGQYNVLSAVKPRQVDGELKMNISAEQVQLIFSQHPLVKRVYDQNVPKLNEMDFWSRFFLSRLFKKLKGERIVETDSTDPTFDRYLNESNDNGLNERLSGLHIPHIIDLEGNEENQGGSKRGNRADFTMRPGSAAKVPIVRTLNSLSEKIMAHVAPSDIDPADPIGMDEETFNLLALRDLQGDPEENRIMLNIKQQSQFFANEKSAISAEAALYEKQIPADVLSGLRTDLGPSRMDSRASGGLDLGSAIGVLEDSDSEEEDDEKTPHVGSKASLADAQKQILEGIRARRTEIDGSDANASLSGLSQKLFDRLTLTHATTTEFLHHFWVIFLSGDPDRAGELAKMVETLERAMDRINAVAADAETEKEDAIRKQKQHIRDIWEKTDSGYTMSGAIGTSQKADGLPAPSRPPLLPRAFSPNPVASKQVRRKTSFLLLSDSTDDFPSPHTSIYEAQYFSSNSSEENNNRLQSITSTVRKASTASPDNDENSKIGEPRTPPRPTVETEFLYGHGTILDTITEQKSTTTIRSLARSKSADGINLSLLNHRDSFVLMQGPRRKHSFSLDDLALIKQTYHEACSTIECKAIEPLSIREIYAQPRAPLHAPLCRPITPPGMPSWTAAQNIPGLTQRTQSRPTTTNWFLRWLFEPANEISLSSRVSGPAPSQPSAVTLRGRAPRFRAPRSAYTSIQQHPFNTAPVASIRRPSIVLPTSNSVAASQPKRKFGFGKRVRFTPSATARDSEMNILRNAIEATSSSALSPIAPIPETARQVAQTVVNCPHRHGRRAALKATSTALNHIETNPPSNEYITAQSEATDGRVSVASATTSVQPPIISPLRPDSISSSRCASMEVTGGLQVSSSRAVSVSSTANLMSGALQPDKQRLGSSSSRCWKCYVDKSIAKIDRWWMNSAGCLCFVCCGFDIEDDRTGQCGVQSQNYRPFGATGFDNVGPRRVILNRTPAILL